MHLGSLCGAVQTQMIATPTLKVLVQRVWDEAKNLHFQQFPVMLVPGPELGTAILESRSSSLLQRL